MTEKISAALQKKPILISDGAWGTFLQQQGLKPGECPESWNLSHPETILKAARAYIEAGADMIQTNSFGGSRFKLEQYELADQTEAINKAAAELSRQAAGSDHWVIASVGPTGKMLAMGDVKETDFFDVFAQQEQALSAGGADALCIETMSDIAEAVQAVKAAKNKTDCEVIATFTWSKTKQGSYKTMMGATPEAAAGAVLDAGADIIGANCGNGIKGMIDIVKILRQTFSNTPILVHANAGLPQNINGRDVFPEAPAAMAAQVKELNKAGADIIGGCCGTTPEHIKAIKAALTT
ncbi:MAG TPA: homocysteine S-methyltransferase family protein [Spirochaetota bacterium]|nr:homocysteine S-methyltransferase family protein [Spirochaetota bacterium]